jgi:DNA invertase Pin-like site-specific DNA recombinase
VQSAIAYVRVSTERQAQNGISLDGQLVQIRKFAEQSGFRIKGVFRESGSAMNEDIRTQPKLREAILLSRQKRWPIIVASLDRLSRNVETVEKYAQSGKLDVISASNGPQADYVVLRSQAVRAQKEGREIGRRTKEGLARAKARGVRLGNPVNLEKAQRKGAEANRAIAQQRAQEFKRMLAEARRQGAKTAEQIASTLNRLGYSTARGGSWTPENVYRVLRKTKALKVVEASPETPSPTQSPSTQRQELTPEEVAWLEAGSTELDDKEWGIF